jgi:hypothetical protein
MKKNTPESAAQRKPVSTKLSAIAFDMVDAEARSTDGNTIAKRIAKGEPMKSAEALGPDYSVDKRRNARREHTNHFTNRAPKKSQ